MYFKREYAREANNLKAYLDEDKHVFQIKNTSKLKLNHLGRLSIW